MQDTSVVHPFGMPSFDIYETCPVIASRYGFTQALTVPRVYGLLPTPDVPIMVEFASLVTPSISFLESWMQPLSCRMKADVPPLVRHYEDTDCGRDSAKQESLIERMLVCRP
jgi:hypothetical protein